MELANAMKVYRKSGGIVTDRLSGSFRRTTNFDYEFLSCCQPIILTGKVRRFSACQPNWAWL